MPLRTWLAKPRRIKWIAGTGLIGAGLLIRFAFHEDSVLPLFLLGAGSWLLLSALKEALTRKSPDDLYRRSAA